MQADKPKLVIGYYDKSEAQRLLVRSFVKEFCHNHELDDFELISGFTAALSHALPLSRKHAVKLVGSINHIAPPPGVDRDMWRRTADIYAAQHGVELVLVDAPERISGITPIVGQFKQLIRDLHTSVQDASKQHKATQRPEGSAPPGRPPFGYQAVDGFWKPDPIESRAIRYIVEWFSAGKSPKQIIDALRNDFRQFKWSYVKLQRIMAKLPLYCYGILNHDGQEYQLDGAAFLSPQWIGTEYRSANQ